MFTHRCEGSVPAIPGRAINGFKNNLIIFYLKIYFFIDSSLTQKNFGNTDPF